MLRHASHCLSLGARAASLTVLLAASALADQVTLKNGDRISGTIVKQESKSISIKTAGYGAVSIPWANVATVASDQPVAVGTADGRALIGPLAAVNGSLRVMTSNGPVTLAFEDIASISQETEYRRYLNPGLSQLWTGMATVGLAGAFGNARTLTYTTGVNASRTTRTDKATLYFNVIKATALVDGFSTTTAQAVRGGASYNHDFSSRAFLNVFNDYEYDRFQDLDLRFSIGGGAGLHAIETETNVLDFTLGADYNHSTFSNFTRSFAEGFAGDDYSLKLGGGRTSVVQSFRAFHSLSGPGIYRLSFDLGVTTKVNSWLTWNVSFSDRYLSAPPPGFERNDGLYTTGLGITFGGS